MLTVKHRDVMGTEHVFGVREIEYRPADSAIPAKSGFTPSTGRVQFFWPSGHVYDNERPEFVYEGSIYVMNDSGKTVANYDLGGWAGPQKADPEELS